MRTVKFRIVPTSGRMAQLLPAATAKWHEPSEDNTIKAVHDVPDNVTDSQVADILNSCPIIGTKHGPSWQRVCWSSIADATPHRVTTAVEL